MPIYPKAQIKLDRVASYSMKKSTMSLPSHRVTSDLFGKHTLTSPLLIPNFSPKLAFSPRLTLVAIALYFSRETWPGTSLEALK